MGSIETTHDVVIVGGGPVSLTLGLVLHAYGQRPIILERHATQYAQPRAVAVFHQAVQVFDALGLHDHLFKDAFEDLRRQLADVAQLISIDETPLLDIPMNGQLRNGKSRVFNVHQPSLERVLESACDRANIPVIRSTELLDVHGHENRLQLRVSGPTGEYDLHTRFVVGCDGAQSTVRQKAGIKFIDSGGIRSRWLVVDVTPKNIDYSRHWKDAFMGKQYLDYHRPITSVPSPLKRRRWEFMLLSEETSEQAKDPDFAWPLLENFGCTPENANIERNAVYTMEGRWAEIFHKDRVLLAGDAAHTTPHFLGQGLNSGLRDANNLAWRLDFALRNPEKNYRRLFEDFSNEQLGTSKKLP